MAATKRRNGPHLVGLDQHLVDDVVPDVDDGHDVRADPDAALAVRYGLEFLDQQAAEGVRLVEGQVPVEPAVQRAQAGGAVDQVAAVVQLAHGAEPPAALAGEFADDFLEDVVQRDQALDVTVLVDHQRHTLFLFLEFQQLPRERCSLGHEVGAAHGAFQVVDAEVAERQLGDDAADVQQTHDVVDAFTVDRHAGVHGLRQLVDDIAPFIVQVDTDDVSSRHHDVIDRGLFQVEDVDQHALVIVRNVPALGEKGPQFVAVEPFQRHHVGLDAEGFEQQVGERIHQPDDRVEHLEQGDQDIRSRERHPFRVQGGQRLWRDLGEDQHDDRHHQGRNPDAVVAELADGDDRRDRGCEDIDHVVAQQDQADQAVGPCQQFLGETGAAVATVGQVFQAIAVDGHQAGFRTREKPGKYDQDQQRNVQTA